MVIDGSIIRAVSRRLAVTTAVVVAALAGAVSAQAYQAAPGWIASDYVTGFSFQPGSAGPVGLAFDGSGNLLVADSYAAALHKVAPGGGSASGTVIHDGYGGATGLAFDKSGRLYMARGVQHDVVELNPASGEVIRTVAAGLPCPAALATDPISGDLFVSNVFCPGGSIMRISNFENGPGTIRPYAGTQDADGLTFAPDGTLFAAAEDQILEISGTDSSSPGSVSELAHVPLADGIVYAPATARDDAYLVVVRNDGEIDRVNFDGSTSPVFTGGSRGDLVTVGPDRCIYADLQDRVIKLGPSTGECFFSPPVQPGVSGGSQQVLGERVANRVVDTGARAKAPKSVFRGSRFTLTVRAFNGAKTTAHTVKLTDKLPRGTKFVSVRSARGVACRRNRKRTVVTCRKATLAPGKSYTVKIVVRALRGSSYTNVVTVKSNDLDPRPGNNRATSRTKVQSGTNVLGVQRRGSRLPRTTG